MLRFPGSAELEPLTNHAPVLPCIASDLGARLRDVAASVGVTVAPPGRGGARRGPAWQVKQHVYPWIKGERVLEHEQRPPTRIRQQSVEEQKRVSRPGMPGQHDDGPGSAPALASCRSCWPTRTFTRSPNSQQAARYRRASSCSIRRKFRS
jgi:hypothetical protein